MIEKNISSVLNYIQKGLQSFFVAPVVFLIAFICWLFNATLVALFLFWAVFVCILIFCKDVKNIFALILYVSFFLSDIVTDPHWLSYGIIIAGAFLSLVAFMIKRCLEKKSDIKFGKLFVPLIVMDLALILGGVIGRFKILVFLIVIAACIVTYILYFIALNFTSGLRDYFAKLFVLGGFIISIQVFISGEAFFSSQGVNVAATFLLLAMIGSFSLGVGKKYDFISVLVTAYFLLAILVTCCRMVLLIACITELVIYILLVNYSNNAKNFVWANILIAIAVVLFGFVFTDVFRPYVYRILGKINYGDGTSGRIGIFSWCFERIKEYPAFGYGFMADEHCIATREGTITLIMAHNTAVQWLTSLGFIGASLTVYFYIVKFKFVFSNMNRGKLFTLFIILGIALSGITDQAPSTDFFMFLMPLLIIAAEEKVDEEN